MSNVYNDNVCAFRKDKPQRFTGLKPRGKFPSGSVPAYTIKVGMAVGMYQFHDMLANVGMKENYSDINDNNTTNVKDIGTLNV